MGTDTAPVGQTAGPLGKMYSNIRTGASLVKDMGRLREIVTVLVRHGFGEIIERLNLQDNTLVGLVAGRTGDAEPVSTARRIFLAIEDLGPAFIKLGQILSTRPDLIPEDVIRELQNLQDQVAPVDFAQMREPVEKSTGAAIEEQFEVFDETPLASASIAQVHRGRLKTGEDVVVKILRPRIRAVISSDLNILYFLARAIQANIPEAQIFNLTGIVREFERAVSKEVDLLIEASNINRFRRSFEGYPGMHIPKVHARLSSRDVLVMEFIDGVKITEAPQRGHDAVGLAKRCVAIVFKQLFRDPLFHGDGHPGNVLVTKNGDIALIDFGLVGRMSPRMRDRVIDLVIALTRQDWEAIAEIFYDVGIKDVPVQYDAFAADVIEVMENNFMGRTLGEIEFGAFFRDLVDGAVRHRIRMPVDYTLVFKALITMEGIGKSLSPELDLVEEMRPHVEAVAKERYSPEAITKQMLRDVAQFTRLMRQFPITARQVLEGVENGRVRLGVEIPELKRQAEVQRQGGSRVALSAAMTGLLISGALSLGADMPRLAGVPYVSALLLGLGLACGAWLLLMLLSDSPK